MRCAINGRAPNLFPSESRYPAERIKSVLWSQTSKYTMLAGTRCASKRHRTKQIIFKQVAEQAEQSCGFCRNDSWKASTTVHPVLSLAEVSLLSGEISRPQLKVSTPA